MSFFKSYRILIFSVWESPTCDQIYNKSTFFIGLLWRQTVELSLALSLGNHKLRRQLPSSLLSGEGKLPSTLDSNFWLAHPCSPQLQEQWQERTQKKIETRYMWIWLQRTLQIITYSSEPQFLRALSCPPQRLRRKKQTFIPSRS